MMDEMHCPLCDQPVRSDAALHRSCDLCGMGLPHDAEVFMVGVEGQRLTFCSLDCLLLHRSASSSER
jgi:hypothetical protein